MAKKKTETPLKEILTKISNLKQKPNGKPRADFFEEILADINNAFGLSPPKSISDAFRKKLNRTEKDLRMLGYYFEKIENHSEAIVTYKLAIRNYPDAYKAYSNLARLFSFLNDYPKSLEYFEQCLKKDIQSKFDLSRITYNYGFTLLLEGNYAKANRVFNELTKIYEAFPPDDRNADYWLDFGDHLLFNLGDPKGAISHYQQGLTKTADDHTKIETLLDLVQASNKLIKGSYRLENSEIVSLKYNNRKYLREALTILNKSKNNQQKIAELYFHNQEYEQAKTYYIELLDQKVSVLGDEKGDIYYFLGLCHFYLNEFKDAIENFDLSIHKSSTNFVKIHLAHSYRKIKEFEKAQEIFDQILHDAPYNTDALIGNTFLQSDIANEYKTTNTDHAINLFQSTITHGNRLLKDTNTPKYKRNLTQRERCEVKYLMSNANIELVHLLKDRSQSLDFLKSSKNLLEDLANDKANPYFFKSKRILAQVNDVIGNHNRVSLGTKRPLLTVGALAFVLSVFLIFIGRPGFEFGYELDTALLSKQLDVPKEPMDSIFNKKKFGSITEMTSYVYQYYGKEISQESPPLVLSKGGYFQYRGSTVGDPVIIFLLSASVVFVLLGFLLDQIKILKVGVIHVERTEQNTLMEQIEIKMNR